MTLNHSLEEKFLHAQDLEFQGRFKEAEDILSTTIDALVASADTVPPQLYNLRGLTRRMQGKRSDAMMDYVSAGLVAAHLNNLSFQRKGYKGHTIQESLSWVNIADLYRGFGRFDLARLALKRAAETNSDDDVDYEYAEAKRADQMGLVLVAEKKFDRAVFICDLARDAVNTYVELHKSEQDTSKFEISHRDAIRLKSNVLQHLAIGFEYAKDEQHYAEAYRLHGEALELANSISDMAGILNVVTATARLNNQTKRHLEALHLYEKAWKTVENTDYARGKATVRLHFAITCLELQMNDDAAKWIDVFCQDVRDKQIVEGDYALFRPYVDRLMVLAEEQKIGQMQQIRDTKKLMYGDIRL